ncbi:NADP-dependent oxidoreductase [Naumannella cuiyingiana]|uniref:NADPH-dependent curcumin reductase CurA n=1 Tax=Naumannella cuiyingiana TaxID=1347891 RepID=A0A7Z0IJK4_9ACTN|nr:NADP-dependent oxidoreductase [Naumannella cuiyingiana]NYI69634.1 NADPH-dependent curcumin reductase CurA [Naumannella cuiyingiana]
MSTAAPTASTRIVLAARPHGEPTASDFRTETVELPPPGPGEALLRTRYLSLDPYMRGRMSDAPSYAPPVAIGQPMVGATVSEVIDGNDTGLAPGQLVLGQAGWQTASVERADHLRQLDPAVVPPTTALGVLGMPGFTAWAGLRNIGRPKRGETVVVAAATGPVGSVVAQLARAWGCRVVAIAGGPQKCAWLDEHGITALDHRAPDLAGRLAAATPDGIDIYFENVGGAVFEAVLPRFNPFARMPVCGLVSSYNATELPAGPDKTMVFLGSVLRKSLTVRGFIQTEFVDQEPEFLAEVTPLVADGQIAYLEDIVDGLDHAVEAFRGLLVGKNRGKLIIKVS